MFLNVQIMLPFIEIGLLYRGSQQWLSCIVVIRFTGGGNRSTRRKMFTEWSHKTSLTPLHKTSLGPPLFMEENIPSQEGERSCK
jgi:hypothetical protein